MNLKKKINKKIGGQHNFRSEWVSDSRGNLKENICFGFGTEFPTRKFRATLTLRRTEGTNSDWRADGGGASSRRKNQFGNHIYLCFALIFAMIYTWNVPWLMLLFMGLRKELSTGRTYDDVIRRSSRLKTRTWFSKMLWGDLYSTDPTQEACRRDH